MAEALHAAGPNAKKMLEKVQLTVPRAEPPRQRAHLVGINDLRIAVETGPYPVSYFFASWQLAGLDWPHRVVPDAVFALQVGTKHVVVAEYDRSTENMRMLAEKINAYRAGLPDFPVAAVLVIVDDPARLGRLARRIRPREGPLRVLGATIGALRGKDIGTPVFRNVSGGLESVLQPLAELIGGHLPAGSPHEGSA